MEQRCFNALDALFLSLNVLVFYGQSVIATTCNGTIMSDAVRMGVLEEINAIRTMLEKGILTDIDFNEYPKAEAMYKLQWSCEFEEIANGFVQGCQQSPQQIHQMGTPSASGHFHTTMEFYTSI